MGLYYILLITDIYQASLRNIGGSTQVLDRVQNNPPEKLKCRRITYSVGAT